MSWLRNLIPRRQSKVRQHVKRIKRAPSFSRRMSRADAEHLIAEHREWCFECDDTDQRAILAHELLGDWDRGKESG